MSLDIQMRLQPTSQSDILYSTTRHSYEHASVYYYIILYLFIYKPTKMVD